MLVRPVSRLFAVTDAPGMAAPFESRTSPASVLVVWATAVAAQKRRATRGRRASPKGVEEEKRFLACGRITPVRWLLSGANLYTLHSSRRFQTCKGKSFPAAAEMSGIRTFYAAFDKTCSAVDEKKARPIARTARAPREHSRGEISLEVKAPSARTFVHLAVRRVDLRAGRVGADAPRLGARHGLRPEPRRRARGRGQTRQPRDRRGARDDERRRRRVRALVAAGPASTA